MGVGQGLRPLRQESPGRVETPRRGVSTKAGQLAPSLDSKLGPRVLACFDSVRAGKAPDQEELLVQDAQLRSLAPPAFGTACETGGELLSLPLGLGVVNPLPQLEIEAGTDVQQVVADGMGHVPPEPGSRQARLYADRPADDDLLYPS